MNGWMAAAGFQGFFAVAAGAFGAHALRARLDEAAMHTFETGAAYHLPHAAVLAALAALMAARPTMDLGLSAWLFFAGMSLFSGSLYLLALTGLRPLAFVTPLGGLMLLGGWLALAVAGLRDG